MVDLIDDKHWHGTPGWWQECCAKPLHSCTSGLGYHFFSLTRYTLYDTHVSCICTQLYAAGLQSHMLTELHSQVRTPCCLGTMFSSEKEMLCISYAQPWKDFGLYLLLLVAGDEAPIPQGGVRPTFTERPVIRQTDDEKIVFECRIAGDPKPEVTWSVGSKLGFVLVEEETKVTAELVVFLWKWTLLSIQTDFNSNDNNIDDKSTNNELM